MDKLQLAAHQTISDISGLFTREPDGFFRSKEFIKEEIVEWKR